MNENQQLITTAGVSIITIGVSVALYYIQKRTDAIWSLGHHWSQVLKGILSLSISRSEQSIFEEEFKYLIVTSSLFNEQPLETAITAAATRDPLTTQSTCTQQQSLLLRLLTLTLSTVILTILIKTRFNSVSPLLIPCLLPLYITVCYFIYRHHRHVQIRRIHASALDSMHQIISLSQKSDSVLLRILNHFHGLSPEAEHQQRFGTLLSHHFEHYIELVHQLQPLIDTHNLATFRDMYNLNDEIPSLLLEFDSYKYKLDDIDLIHSMICWKRREYLLYLLSLDVMSNHRTHYGKNWRQAIYVNTSLVQEYTQFNRDLVVLANQVDMSLKEATLLSVETVTATPTLPQEISSAASAHSDSRSTALMHRVSALEKHVEDIQAKLFLCKQDTKSLSSGRVSWMGLERIHKRFSQMDENMQTFLSQWEESKQALKTLVEDQQMKLDSIAFLPSPPSSPRDFRPSEEGVGGLTRSGSLSKGQLQRMHSFIAYKTPIRTDTM